MSRRVLSLAASLRDRVLVGVTDLVPAYTSLLVMFDRERIDLERLRAVIAESLQAGDVVLPAEPRSHVVPVRYGGECGPDLEPTARELGLTSSELARRHSDLTYTVLFLGFLPGFPYMGMLPPRLAVGRLANPRAVVPEGSVAIASRQTGIYPLRSPGGWRLLGTTGVTVWDPRRDPPAYFAPGDRVRFVPSDSITKTSRTTAEETPLGGVAAFRVLNAGGPAAVQDLGRPGMGGIGLSAGGTFDRSAMRAANAALGNSQDAAVLEVIGQGLSLEAISTVTIALGGGDPGVLLDGRRVTPGLSHLVRGGSKTTFARNPAAAGASDFRFWLAVQGGFAVPVILGSRSTALSAGFGGHRGRPVAPGDTLWRDQSKGAPGEVAGRFVSKPRVRSAESPLRVIPFNGPQSAGGAALAEFAASHWKVSAQSDRIGVRLHASERNALRGGTGELASFGVVRGAIQVTPDGTPIILGPEHQTTGGYPLLGTLAEADWGRLAQAAPGDVLTFQVITPDEASALVP